MSSPQGMLFVAMEVSPVVTEERFNEWYDTEHVPIRLKVPGLNSVVRYKASDAQVPTWLTMYNCDNAGVVGSEAYTSLAALASDNEKDIASKTIGVSRRVYEHFLTKTDPGVPDEDLPSKFILVAGLEVALEDEDELNKWYAEEHIDLLSKIPGWKQCRRYRILEHRQVGAVMEGKPVCKYLAIHEFDNGVFLKTLEMHNAATSEWAKRMATKFLQHELRVFELHKGFKA
ncbi:unnamed protein product [Mycena citricolor]|uniref:Dimeric alpha-beta barrel n=1 Tax=Mycena citricolor TaxID=2018698 RepID=A0AAD2H4W0_9AGAR|nr:unnamed protein product [Mycena citricolor]